MTAGFNSDIVLDGVVYHIQTEDKGSQSSEIVTQIFREGAVVFTRRNPYPSRGDQLNYEAILEGLVRNQHMKLLQFVRSGGLRKKTLLEKALRGHHVEAGSPSGAEANGPAGPPPASSKTGEASLRTEESGAEPADATAEATQIFGSGGFKADALHAVLPQPLVSEELPAETAESLSASLEAQESDSIDHFLLELVALQPVAALPEEPDRQSAQAENRVETVMIPLPEPAPPAESAVPASAPLPQAAPEPPPYDPGEQCEIQLLAAAALIPGEIQPLRLMLRSDRRQLPIPHARIKVKVFGQTIRPFAYSGWSNADGLFAIDLIIPYFTVGTGCVEITAQTSLGSRTMRLDVACPSAAK